MAGYTAPVREMRFVLDHVVDYAGLAAIPAYAEATPDLVGAILEEAGKLAREVIAPTNRAGDQQGAVLENGVVRTADGFADAWKRFREGGWNSLPFDPKHGGQGLPWAIQFAVAEMWASANMSFSLCPMLNQGAVEALIAHGSGDQIATYLGKLISGQWTGTMNLTEPQAGSDLAALRTRALPQGDGSYLIKGSKIFVTWGEHDLVDNIIHMVLARTPDAPPGSKGISMFIVPKVLVNGDGTLGRRNDLRCVSLEHKLGIHASPTCVMAYGDNDECVGYLIGEENRGLNCMFTMMNLARLNVGLEGVGIGERAYQAALAYASERVQGRPLRAEAGADAAIIEHADVRRMLLTMKAYVEAARAIVYFVAGQTDRAKKHPEEETRRRAANVVSLLTPVAKAWSTDVGCEVASIGIQVHGGLGFIEETGAAQHYRDSRIAPIYEGTNGIQAMDLVMRKLGLEGGAVVRGYISGLNELVSELESAAREEVAGLAVPLGQAVAGLEKATEWLLREHPENPNACAAGAAPYLRMFGITAGGALLARQALAAASLLAAEAKNGAEHSDIAESKLVTARFFAQQILPQAAVLLGPVTSGDALFYALDPDQMAV